MLSIFRSCWLLASLAGLVFFLEGCFPSVTSQDAPPKANTSSTSPSNTETSNVLFTERAKEAGLDYVWSVPGKRPLNILQTIGNGCAFLDFNHDGNLDVLLIGQKPELFQGDGKGRFTLFSDFQVPPEHYLGCAIGDIDNDGFDDIYLSGYNTGRLLKNNGSKFSDITVSSGMKPQPWGTSCAFAQTNSDNGLLDLYVGNYAVFGPNTDPQLCKVKDPKGVYVKTSCGPRYYQPVKGVLYQNQAKDKSLLFKDVTLVRGLDKASGKTLGVAFADYDNRGVPSLGIANDEVPGNLFQSEKNAPNGPYKNVAEMVGTAFDRDGNIHGGMGIDWGDIDNDGRLDMFVATFQNEIKSLYRNESSSYFTDIAINTGLSTLTQPYVAFGCHFLDLDNDGNLDIVIANGHVQDNIDKIEPTQKYRQPLQLLRSKHILSNTLASPSLTFEDVGASLPSLRDQSVGRGLATGDYDNDGKTDVLLTDVEGRVRLYHNETNNSYHWLGIMLHGTKSNRSAYGAFVTLEVGDKKILRHYHADGSYLSSSDPRIVFGLGEAKSVTRLTIHWPSGLIETKTNLMLDQYQTFIEGK
jgi:enediyne biosynthesis protein E4